MNKTLVAVLMVGTVTAVVAGGVATSYVGAYNKANTLERNIVATYENNENVLAQYGQKIVEAAQVTEMQRDDFKEVAIASIQSRYGADGSKALFQMLTEQNPSLSPEVYNQLQRMIEAGRNEFQHNQTILVDQKRIYETALGSFWTGMWMGVAGYPRINLKDYAIVSTSRANEAFETKTETSPVKLRN